MASAWAKKMKSDDIDHIYRDGRHYDCLFGEPNMSFWLDIIATYGAPVLELGCGTGKITIPIAEAGYSITGIDLSEAMIQHARRKAKDQKLPVSFKLGDMSSFEEDQKFNVVILPSNNLAHLMDYREAMNCFFRAYDHLSKDGVFVIDAFVPSLSILTKSSDEIETISEYEDPDGKGMFKITASAIYENHTQIRRVTTFQRKPDGSVSEGHLNMKMYFPQELEGLLNHSGLEIIERYGNYQKDEFSSTSMRQIIVARKKKKRDNQTGSGKG
ncbi:Methyltransferase domain family [Verrucomicrobiia bacterium DG1235]|nr:Methyltransferase domain family [Verrucomicrobiae bacterium DG1235]